MYRTQVPTDPGQNGGARWNPIRADTTAASGSGALGSGDASTATDPMTTPANGALPTQNVSTANNTGGGNPNAPWDPGTGTPPAAPPASNNPMTTPGTDAASIADYYKNQYGKNASVQTAAGNAPPAAVGSGAPGTQFGASAFNAPGGYNPTNYATQDTANAMQQRYGGDLAQINSAGPFANATAPQLDLVSNGMAQNAGLLANNVNLYGDAWAKKMHDDELAMNHGGGQTFASGTPFISQVGDTGARFKGDIGTDFSGATNNPGNGANGQTDSMQGNQYGMRPQQYQPQQYGGNSMYGQGGGYGQMFQPDMQPQTQYGGFNSWGNPMQGNPFAQMTYGQQQYNPYQSGFMGQGGGGTRGLGQLMNNMGYGGFGGFGMQQQQGPGAWGQQANQGLYFPSFY